MALTWTSDCTGNNNALLTNGTGGIAATNCAVRSTRHRYRRVLDALHRPAGRHRAHHGFGRQLGNSPGQRWSRRLRSLWRWFDQYRHGHAADDRRYLVSRCLVVRFDKQQLRNLREWSARTLRHQPLFSLETNRGNSIVRHTHRFDRLLERRPPRCPRLQSQTVPDRNRIAVRTRRLLEDGRNHRHHCGRLIGSWPQWHRRRHHADLDRW